MQVDWGVSIGASAQEKGPTGPSDLKRFEFRRTLGQFISLSTAISKTASRSAISLRTASPKSP